MEIKALSGEKLFHLKQAASADEIKEYTRRLLAGFSAFERLSAIMEKLGGINPEIDSCCAAIAIGLIMDPRVWPPDPRTLGKHEEFNATISQGLAEFQLEYSVPRSPSELQQLTYEKNFVGGMVGILSSSAGEGYHVAPILPGLGTRFDPEPQTLGEALSMVQWIRSYDSIDENPDNVLPETIFAEAAKATGLTTDKSMFIRLFSRI